MVELGVEVEVVDELRLVEVEVVDVFMRSGAFRASVTSCSSLANSVEP